MYKTMIDKRFAIAALFLLGGGMVWGQSTPSEPLECGEWQWPAVQSPCPEVQVKQKHDHTPKPQYRHYGWDTVIDCNTREGIVLSCMPYIPVQYFNGTYTVDEIPYNPPDSTFCLTYGAALANMNDPNRKKMPIRPMVAPAMEYIRYFMPAAMASPVISCSTSATTSCQEIIKISNR